LRYVAILSAVLYNESMTTQDLFQEIAALSPVQQESVYSFVYLLKHPDYIPYTLPHVESFTSEREALDFANDCAERLLHAER
jgi:hypothetical protein